MRLELNYAARAPWVPSRRQLVRWIDAVCIDAVGDDAARPRGRRCVVSVTVVGAARSRTLNARYRRKDHATNVLSFAGAGRMPDGELVLGELVICAPVLAAEAREQRKVLAAHWAHITVHGVLHLLGFDHEAAADASKMESREVQILDRLGYSNPYA